MIENKKMTGRHLKHVMSQNRPVKDKIGNWVYRKHLEDDKLYDVEFSCFEDSEGWDHVMYKLLDFEVNEIEEKPIPEEGGLW